MPPRRAPHPQISALWRIRPNKPPQDPKVIKHISMLTPPAIIYVRKAWVGINKDIKAYKAPTDAPRLIRIALLGRDVRTADIQRVIKSMLKLTRKRTSA